MRNLIRYDDLEKKCQTLLDKLEEDDVGTHKCAREVKEVYRKKRDNILRKLERSDDPVSLYIDMLLSIDKYYAEFKSELEDKYGFEIKDDEATQVLNPYL